MSVFFSGSRETAKTIGYTRGANVDRQIGYAVSVTVSRGWAERQEDKQNLYKVTSKNLM